MIPLAEQGFPCNDNNYRQLIDYFDKMLASNQIDRGFMVERLGHIKNGFAHPLLPRNFEILPNDQGEKQLLEAFQESGKDGLLMFLNQSNIILELYLWFYHHS